MNGGSDLTRTRTYRTYRRKSSLASEHVVDPRRELTLRNLVFLGPCFLYFLD